MKWYKFQTYILWPSSLVFYALVYFIFGVIADNIDFNDIPFDTSKTDLIINYLIPIKLLQNLLLIYLFHIKSHLSLKFLIVSYIIFMIAGYLLIGDEGIVDFFSETFYIIPYLVFNYIYFNKRKEFFTR